MCILRANFNTHSHVWRCLHMHSTIQIVCISKTRHACSWHIPNPVPIWNIQIEFSSFVRVSEDGDLAFYLSPDTIGCICRTMAAVLETVENSWVWLRWQIILSRESGGIFRVELLLRMIGILHNISQPLSVFNMYKLTTLLKDRLCVRKRDKLEFSLKFQI